MMRWEYYFLPVELDGGRWSVHVNGTGHMVHGEVWSYIDSLGDKGWEMVSVIPTGGPEAHDSAYGLWFKRPKRPAVNGHESSGREASLGSLGAAAAPGS